MRVICCCGVTLALAESLNRDGRFPASKAPQAGLSPARVVVVPSARPAEDRYPEPGVSNVRFVGNSATAPEAGDRILETSELPVYHPCGFRRFRIGGRTTEQRTHDSS